MADNDDIPFNRDFPLKPGVVDEVCPGVRSAATEKAELPPSAKASPSWSAA